MTHSNNFINQNDQHLAEDNSDEDRRTPLSSPLQWVEETIISGNNHNNNEYNPDSEEAKQQQQRRRQAQQRRNRLGLLICSLLYTPLFMGSLCGWGPMQLLVRVFLCVHVGGCGYVLGGVLISGDKQKGTELNGIDE